MSHWKLVDLESGTELNFGDIRQTSRGDRVTITGFYPPYRPESTGRVFVNFVSDGVPTQYCPSAIDARYEEISLDDDATPNGKIDRLLGEFFLRPKVPNSILE